MLISARNARKGLGTFEFNRSEINVYYSLDQTAELIVAHAII
jgi:hypothetical protein